MSILRVLWPPLCIYRADLELTTTPRVSTWFRKLRSLLTFRLAHRRHYPSAWPNTWQLKSSRTLYFILIFSFIYIIATALGHYGGMRLLVAGSCINTCLWDVYLVRPFFRTCRSNGWTASLVFCPPLRPPVIHMIGCVHLFWVFLSG